MGGGEAVAIGAGSGSREVEASLKGQWRARAGRGAGHPRLRVSRAAREGSAAASAAPPSGPMLFSLRRNGGRGGGSRSARSAADGAEVMIAAVNALVCVCVGGLTSAGDVYSALTGEAPKNTEAAGDGHGGAWKGRAGGGI